jgi:hypothetical protein
VHLSILAAPIRYSSICGHSIQIKLGIPPCESAEVSPVAIEADETRKLAFAISTLRGSREFFELQALKSLA